jgi:hypothetical protein
MVDTQTVTVDGNSDEHLQIGGYFDASSTGSISLTNKSSVTTTPSVSVYFYEDYVEFVIPQSYLTSTNLPATFSASVNGTVVSTGTILLDNSKGDEDVDVVNEVEISDDSGNPIPVAGLDHNGTARAFFVDTSGRQKISHGQPPSVATNLTAVNNAIVLNLDGFSTATFYFAGTFAGANLTFEQSPDSTNGTDGTWFTTLASPTGTTTSPAATTGSISASIAYDVAAPGASFVRARLTAITSGTVNAQATASTSSIDPSPSIATHAVTQSGTWTTTGTPANSTLYSVVTTASTNAAVARTVGANLYELSVSNPTTSVAYLKIYNKASAPTVGTDVPLLTIPVPATSFQEIQFAAVGKRFSAGIAVAVTANAVATDTTVTVAGLQISLSYI